MHGDELEINEALVLRLLATQSRSGHRCRLVVCSRTGLIT